MSPTALEPRDYQRRVIDKTYAAYGEGRRRVPIVVPTGGGKTVIFSHISIDCVQAAQPVLVLAHRTELIDQAEQELRGASSGLDVGVVMGPRREFMRSVVVSSMQTAVRPGALQQLARRRFGLVIVDECHHIAAPSYQTILKELGVFTDSGPRLLGVTATLDRADGLALGDTFDGEPAEVVPISELIEKGHLLRPRAIRVKVDGLDLSAVKRSRTSESGLDDRAVAAAMHDSLAPAAVARAVLEHCAGRKGVAFLPSVELSKEQARVFAEHGLKSVHVDADTPTAVRKEIIRRARLGDYDVVCNVGLFTEGTNVPIWSYVVTGRPTMSGVLYQQMIGRPMRPYAGQSDCLVLDPTGTTTKHRLVSLVNLLGAEAVEPLDDELREFDEAADEQDEREPGTAEPAPPGADGELAYELVDLFSASHTAWQRSPRSVWFLPAGDGRAVFLAPAHEVDLYDVRWTDGALVHEDPCDISAAMTWGEQAARAVADRPIERAAEWRGKKMTRRERMEAIYRGEAPGGPDAPVTVGALAAARDTRWAAEAIDTLPCVSEVSPSGYWRT
jgi:superfamily II DNA or RNA helicase